MPTPAHTALPVLAPSPTQPSARLGRVALVLVLVAATASIGASVVVGATVGPMQVAHGPLLSDTPASYSMGVLALLGSQVLWGLMGAVALVLGVVAIAQRRSRTAAIWAVITAVAAPVLSFTAFLVLVLATSPLG